VIGIFFEQRQTLPEPVVVAIQAAPRFPACEKGAGQVIRNLKHW
jgi:hypothetical protein